MVNFNHTAVAYRGGKVIATGENGYKGRQYSRSFCTTHAEVNCIQNIKFIKNRKRRDVIIWSYFDGAYPKNSKPCANCCKSLYDFGIRKIGYFDGESWLERHIEDVIKTAITSSGDRTFSKKILSADPYENIDTAKNLKS